MTNFRWVVVVELQLKVRGIGILVMGNDSRSPAGLPVGHLQYLGLNH